MADVRVQLDLQAIQEAVRTILQAVGEDPSRPGLAETPQRVARMYAELFSGLRTDPAAELVPTDEPQADGLVVVRDIPLYSMCEHHLLPFLGRVHVAYLPEGGRIAGFSRIVRLVDGYARRPQVQERLTEEVADALWRKLRPRGVAVWAEAEHLCMVMRGVRAPGSRAVTTAFRGSFETDPQARREALAMLASGAGGPSTGPF